jgi:peptidoglycan/LPS O-acetylase OafA/YrhL
MMTAAVSLHEWKFSGGSWVEISPVLRALPSFVFGAALFYNRNIVSRLPAPGFVLAAATAGSIAAMMSGAPQLLTLLIIYLVAIAAVAADAAGVSSALVRRLAPLGQLTYSIYMWHLLLILIFINVAGSYFLPANGYPAAILPIACYSSILIISYLSLFYIETPARRWIDGIDLFKPAFNPTLPRCSNQP